MLDVSLAFVKSPVFPFSKFPGVDPALGPEMRSTGEVMGVGESFGEAFAKAQLGAGTPLPDQRDRVHQRQRPRQSRGGGSGSQVCRLRLQLAATRGTAAVLKALGCPSRPCSR